MWYKIERKAKGNCMFSGAIPKFAGLLATAFLLQAATPTPTPKDVSDSKYKPGQRWTYKTRPSEPDSTLIILRTVDIGKERVVLVRIEGLKANFCKRPVPLLAFVSIAKSGLDSSVIKIIETKPAPSFDSFYQGWLKTWDNGKPKYQTEDVRGMLDNVENKSNRSCP